MSKSSRAARINSSRDNLENEEDTKTNKSHSIIDKSSLASTTCDEIESILSDKMQGIVGIKIDEEAWQLRTELLNRYIKMLESDIKLAFNNRVIHKLWAFGVKLFIDVFKKSTQCGANGKSESCMMGIQSLDNEFLTSTNTKGYDDFANDNVRIANFRYARFLEQCRGNYLGILFSVKNKYARYCLNTDGKRFSSSDYINSNIDSLVSEPMMLLSFRLGETSSSSKVWGQKAIPDKQTDNRNDVECAAKGVIHLLLIGLGDIAFCLQDFVGARKYYLQAADVGTTMGQPYFQLSLLYERVQALLSTGNEKSKMFDDIIRRISEGDHRISQIFYLIRAACVPVWFPSATEGLDRFVDFTLAKSSFECKNKVIMPQRSPQCDDRFQNIEDLIGQFVFIFATIFKFLRLKENNLNGSDHGCIVYDKSKTRIPPDISREESTCTASMNIADNSVQEAVTDTEDELPSYNTIMSCIHRIRSGFVDALRNEFLPGQCLLQISAICIHLISRVFEVEKNIRINQHTDDAILVDFNLVSCASSLFIVLLEQIVRVVAIPTPTSKPAKPKAFLSSVYILLIYAFYSDTDCESVIDNEYELERAYDFYKPTEKIVGTNRIDGTREVVTKSKLLKMPTSFWINLGILLSAFIEIRARFYI